MAGYVARTRRHWHATRRKRPLSDAGAAGKPRGFKAPESIVKAVPAAVSLPFTTAVALTRDGRPARLRGRGDPHSLVRDLARRIELDPVTHDGPETPHVWPAAILIDETGRRHVLRTRPHKGSPRNPFTWDDACEKFRRYTTRVIGAQGATTIVDAVGELERAADMGGIARLLVRA